MKVSIWQQFSSNHSNGFAVVGKFKNLEDTKNAAEQFRTIIKTIRETPNMLYPDASEAEKSIGNYYDIEWTRSLNWVGGDYQVVQFDNYVMVSDIFGSTWMGALYIDQIMKKLSEEIYVEEDAGVDGIAIELKCDADSVENAIQLYKTLDGYFVEVRAERGHLIHPPWRELSKPIYEGDETTIYDDAYYGYVHRDQTQLSFTHLTFASIGYGLPVLIAYLKQEGCTEIEYTLEQRPYDEIYEEDDK